MPYRDKEKLWTLYARMKELPEEAEKELPTLVELRKTYPNVPAIYNYIGLVYVHSKQMEKYFDILMETTRRFPDYLFGKISLAEYYLNQGRHEEVSKILDKKFEIYLHYPPTVTVFHVSEVRAFYSIVGIYYARSNRMSRALFCYFILDEVDPEHQATQILGDEIIRADLSGANLRGQDLRGADLTGAYIAGVDSSGIRDSRGVKADLIGADLTGATWTDGRVCAEESVSECK